MSAHAGELGDLGAAAAGVVRAWAEDDAPGTRAEPGLKAPFPAFGGKSRVSGVVWRRLGDVRNYVEPFCFSAAVLLKRPACAGGWDSRVETISDLNAFVPNFWRAVNGDPEAVAAHADWPVIEADLHARHRWLIGSAEAGAALARVREDPEFFDARLAGWWCWGACCWIGSGWCDDTHRNAGTRTRPALATDGGGNGVHRGPTAKLPHMDGAGRLVLTPDRRVGFSQGGWGVNAGGEAARQRGGGIKEKRPQLSGFGVGKGVCSTGQVNRLIGGECSKRRAWLEAWMFALADRLRAVRVCCGDWRRVCDSPSTMTRIGTTGVFLDPPYRVRLACGKKNRTAHIYANDRSQDVGALCDQVREWCLRWGREKDVRIALCGLEGEYPGLEEAGWSVHAWTSKGGYGNQSGSKNENRERERIWFSPHCLPEEESGLFAAACRTEEPP